MNFHHLPVNSYWIQRNRPKWQQGEMMAGRACEAPTASPSLWTQSHVSTRQSWAVCSLV